MCTFAQKIIFPLGVSRNCRIVPRGPGRTLCGSGADQPGEPALEVLRKRDLVILLAVAASTLSAILSHERCSDLLAENGGPFKGSHRWVSSWLYVNLRWTCHSGKLSACAKRELFPHTLARNGKNNSSDVCTKRIILSKNALRDDQA
jgi:hypothetical protein